MRAITPAGIFLYIIVAGKLAARFFYFCRLQLRRAHEAIQHASGLDQESGCCVCANKTADGDGRRPPGGPGTSSSPHGEDSGGKGRDTLNLLDVDQGGTTAAVDGKEQDDSIAIADLIRRAATFASQIPGHNVRSGTSSSQAIELKQRERIEVPEWNDAFLKDRSVMVAFRIFSSSFLGWLDTEGFEEIMRGEEIPVGSLHIDKAWLRQKYGDESVRKATRV